MKLLRLGVLLTTLLTGAALVSAQPAEPLELIRDQEVWFDKRFLLDETLEELYLLLPKSEQTDTIVLVRPDGTKIYADSDLDNVRWRASLHLDAVQLQQLEPGPWQIHMAQPDGQPIYLLREFDLAASPIPQKFFKGDVLRLDAWLKTPNGKLTAPLVGLSRGTVRIAEGRRGRAPIFLIAAVKDTHQVPLADANSIQFAIPVNMSPGIYDLRLTLDFGIFGRNLDLRFEVLPSPFRHELRRAGSYLEPHKVEVSLVETDQFQPETVRFEGRLTLPDGSSQPVELTAGLRWPKRVLVPAVPEGGIYQLELSATGLLTSGEEQRLKLETYRFASPPDPLWLAERQALQQREMALLAASAAIATEAAKPASSYAGLGWVLGLNAVLLGGGFGGVFWHRRRKNRQDG